MTDKLHCPFCGAELKNACAQVIYFCPNDECHKAKDWYASKQVWQALIDGKKAQDALKVAINALKYVEKHEEDDYPNDVHYRIDLALRRITSITKQGE